MPDPRARRTAEPHEALAWRVTLAVPGIPDARAGRERAAGEGVGEAQEAARREGVKGASVNVRHRAGGASGWPMKYRE